MADPISFDDLIPGQAQAAPAVQPLTPDEQAVKDANPGITDDQARYAVRAAKLRDPAAAEGTAGNPAYDRPGKVGDDTTVHVTPQGQAMAPGGAPLGFDDLIPKETPLGDLARSAASGLSRGVAGFADFVAPAIGLGPLENPGELGADKLGHPSGRFFQNAAEAADKNYGYHPQTTPGRYAQTIGEFAPAAAIGGEGFVGRAANALLPAVGSQFAGDVAHEMGASPAVERGVRVAGALAGGAGASLRLDPGALRAGAEDSAATGSAPTLEKLTAAKDAAYKAVDDADIRFTPQAFNGLLTDMATKMDEAGFSAGNHKKAAQMIADIGASARAEQGYSPTLSQVDKLRQQIGRDVASSSEPGDRRMGQIMRRSVDDFVAKATPDDLATSTDPSQAAGLLNTARDLNTRVEKLKALDNLDEAASDRAAATGVGTNTENATRQNMIRFKNQIDNLTPDEKAAVQRAIDGTFGQNALRGLGALSPERGAIGSMVNIGAGVASHGASVPLSIAAILARRGAAGAEEANVQALRDLIASGGRKIDLRDSQNALAPSRTRFIQFDQPVGDAMIPAMVVSGPATSPEPRPR